MVTNPKANPKWAIRPTEFKLCVPSSFLKSVGLALHASPKAGIERVARS
jgi:hypothetical protein